MATTLPDLAQLKAGMKHAWTAGDFGRIATFTAQAADDFVQRIGIRPGSSVLDVACGTGNTAIPAAHTGASVTGVDIAPNLLAQARQRAAAENLDARFEEGDAEDLPFPDRSFDVVLTMFGAMFAPRPERVASELLRVCKPGGVIAMANWTPEGFVGKSFQITSRTLPPPPGVPAPSLWGDEATVRQRFSSGVSNLSTTRQRFCFHYPFSPRATVDFFRQYFGPTQVAFSRLDQAGQATLSAQMEQLWTDHNQADDGTTLVETEYLDVRAIRA
jgi:SAM-dependent methyltransferase